MVFPRVLYRMEVIFNGKKLSVETSNLNELLKSQQLIDKTGIAVAINNSVVPKSNWANTTLQENDEILIITAAAGG